MNAPTPRDLTIFGWILPLVWALLGGAATHAVGPRAGQTVWAAGAVLVLLYWSVRALRRPFYDAWMGAVEPLGQTVSHVLLALVFFTVVTPVGVVLKLAGRDPLRRRLRRGAGSYWVPHNPGGDPRRYLRQS